MFHHGSMVWQSGKVGSVVKMYLSDTELLMPWNGEGYCSVRWLMDREGVATMWGELSWVEVERLRVAIMCPECTDWMAAGSDYICVPCRWQLDK